MKNSKNNNFSFELFYQAQASSFYAKRTGETRVGEIVPENSVANSKFILLGIEESAGPIANNGFSGSENAWSAFLANFLNTQIHKNFTGKEIKISFNEYIKLKDINKQLIITIFMHFFECFFPTISRF
jgi:hypothetical protein